MPDIKRENYTFSKKHCLSSRKLIDRLFQKGKFASHGFLKFRYIAQQNGYSRVVISISKRVGKAPSRNRLKRLIREALRLSGYLQRTSINCAFYITTPLQKKPTLKETQNHVQLFFKHLANGPHKKT